MNDLNITLWKDSLPGMSYLYPVFNNQANFDCRGRIESVEFCYRYSTSLNISSSIIFTLFLLTLGGNEIWSSEIQSSPMRPNSPMNQSCFNFLEGRYCCDVKEFNDSEAIHFPNDNFIIGMRTSDSPAASLQQFFQNSTIDSYNVPMSHATNSSILNEGMTNITGPVQEQSMLVVRFNIGK